MLWAADVYLKTVFILHTCLPHAAGKKKQRKKLNEKVTKKMRKWSEQKNHLKVSSDHIIVEFLNENRIEKFFFRFGGDTHIIMMCCASR